jgi:hypothetical protein
LNGATRKARGVIGQRWRPNGDLWRGAGLFFSARWGRIAGMAPEWKKAISGSNPEWIFPIGASSFR